LRTYVEPLITKSKNDTTHSRRTVFSYLKDKYAVSELFREVAVKVADRPGGYTRILKTGTRFGDAADMCIIELVDYNTTYVKESAKPAAKKTRRGAKPKKADSVAEEVVAETKHEETKEESTEAKSE
jgi:large subunit ribosomal protein L17